MNWEYNFLFFLQDMHTPLLDKIMLIFTKMGNIGMPWIGIAVILLCFKKTRKIPVCIYIRGNSFYGGFV